MMLISMMAEVGVRMQGPHTVPTHNTAPLPLSQPHLLRHSSMGGGGVISLLWRDCSVVGEEPEYPQSPTPPLPPPTPKVKMSLKDYAMRKRKLREEEMANQVAFSVSPGSTTSALEPTVFCWWWGGGVCESEGEWDGD